MTLASVPPGHLATIVTSLEMTTRPPLRAVPESDLQLRNWGNIEIGKYRALYRRVGEPWLWFSRLEMDDLTLSNIIGDPLVKIWAVVDARNIEVGILELDFRQTGQCEIAFFGLIPELTGRGYGRWLMAMALQSAWSGPDAGTPVTRVWVHTCTLDGPGALAFYRQSGFTPYETMVETFPDPRQTGLIPRDAAPQIPFIG